MLHCILNSLAMSSEFSIIQSFILRGKISALFIRLPAPISLNNFHTLARFLALNGDIDLTGFLSRPLGYKTHFMLNSTKHKNILLINVTKQPIVVY